MTRLLLLRHGESEGNVDLRLQGNVPFPLTELGRRQGAALAERIAAEGADVLYTSPAKRAHETSEIIAAATGLTPGVLEGVGEYDFGEASGRTMRELAEEHPEWGAALREGRQPPPFPGEEGPDAFRERVMAALSWVVEHHPDECVAVVTHAAIVTLFCQQIAGVRTPKGMGFLAIDNCSITVVDAAPEDALPPGMVRWSIVTLNETCHVRD